MADAEAPDAAQGNEAEQPKRISGLKNAMQTVRKASNTTLAVVKLDNNQADSRQTRRDAAANDRTGKKNGGQPRAKKLHGIAKARAARASTITRRQNTLK